MNPVPRRRPGLPVSARLRLTLGYAAFLVVSGMAVLAGVYIVVRYIPDYPLTTSDPSVTHVNITSRGEIVEALVDVTQWVLFALAAIGLVGGWFLAGWVLRPLHRIDAAVRTVAAGRLDHRIRLTGPDDEFRRLADAFDHMLDRLQDAFDVQERFAANASHELRTPLAITATMLDVARREPGHDPLLDRLTEVNARAVGLTEALLRLADVDAVTAAAEPLDLADPVRRAVAEAREEAERRGVDLRLDAAAAPVTGDPELLLRLADNLVRNTLRHNAEGGTAAVSVGRAPDGGAVLRTENTGPVLEPGTVARLTEPFLRGQGRTRRRGGEEGYGLGLALVSRVVEVHGGTLDLVPRPGGGLTVTVVLPGRDRLP